MRTRRPPLWSFAVIADSHVDPDDGAIANRRLRQTVAALNRHKPAFVLHLGDVGHPLPDSPRLGQARAHAVAILGELAAPLHLVPGNHDVGDKPLDTMPAAHVKPDWRRQWIATYGEDVFTVDQGDCRFILFNSPVLNQSDAVNRDLTLFLGRAAAGGEGKRLFLVTHYPLYLDHPGEEGHYDNIGSPAREELLAFCRTHRVEAVFTGHIHNYLYRADGSTHFYGAPSTAFVRRDFSELSAVAPLADYGRQDPQKVGFFWVDVYAGHHVVRMVSVEDLASFAERALLPGDPRDDGDLRLGVNLRHDWAARVEFPFNPPVAPFARKVVRDDYTLRALLESGIADVRIPAADLLDGDKLRRLAELSGFGVGFVAVLAGRPSEPILKAVDTWGRFLDAVELVAPPKERMAMVEALAPAAARHGLALWFGPLLEPEHTDGKVAHKVNYGFDVGCDARAVEGARAMAETTPRAGVVFAAEMARFSGADAARLTAFAEEHGVEVAVLLNRTAADTVAVGDDAALPRQIAEVLAIARANPELRIILDTFMEIDRGYHARSGLVDRRFNSTAAGTVLRDAARVSLTDGA